MKRDEIEAEVSLLLSEMEGDYGDSHEIHMRLRLLLDGMRAYNLAVPDDLLRLERELDAELPAAADEDAAGDKD